MMETREANVLSKVVGLTLCLLLPAAVGAQVFDGLVISNPVYSRTVSLIDTNGQMVNRWTARLRRRTRST